MPRYRRIEAAGRAVFVTVVTRNRRPLLSDPKNVERLMDAMRWAKERWPYRHIAHAVLPGHLHWIVVPATADTCSRLVAAVKRDFTWRLKQHGESGPFWQPRYHDHVIRDEDDLANHLDYVHYNPVKHGLVRRAADYPHSSFHAWVTREVYTSDWGLVKPDSVAGIHAE